MTRVPLLTTALAAMLATAAPAAAQPVTEADAAPLAATLQRILDGILVDRTEVYACTEGANRDAVVAMLNDTESEASYRLILLSQPERIERGTLDALTDAYAEIERTLQADVAAYLRPCQGS